MAKAICSSAKAKCSAGSILSQLNATSCLEIGGKMVATEASSVLPFGQCDITGKPCIPLLLAWSISEKLINQGQRALDENSTIKCSIGGVISFEDPGQDILEIIENKG